MCSDMVAIFLIEGDEAINTIRKLAGPTKPELARIGSPLSIRARYTDKGETFKLSREQCRVVKNVVHTPDSSESAKREGKLFFPAAFAR